MNGESTRQEQAFLCARARLNEGWNCAQSMMLAMEETLGLACPDVVKAATGFGGGVGNMGYTCGAFAGGVLTLGLLYGRDRLEQHEEKEFTYTVCAEWKRRFEEHHGSCNCRDILKVDLSDPETRSRYWASGDNRDRCANHTVGRSAQLAMKLIEEIRNEEGVVDGNTG